MGIYAEAAPPLALQAIADLSRKIDTGRITHLVVASCTGFIAPGIDQIIAAELRLDPASNGRWSVHGLLRCRRGAPWPITSFALSPPRGCS
jgi:predicted naringenin-chalcone synthase